MYYKVLNLDGSTCHGGAGTWSLPIRNEDGTFAPGEWMPPIEGRLEPRANGYHIVDRSQLATWLGPAIYKVEVGTEIVDGADKSVVRTARLLEPVIRWNPRTARLFAADCAAFAYQYWTAAYPDDNRIANAIDVARRYVVGDATEDELRASLSAVRRGITPAWAAAWDAVYAATYAAAWAAAEAATYAAEVAAAWAAARAAISAAVSAARAAAGAGWGAAKAKAKAILIDRLFEYLNSETEPEPWPLGYSQSHYKNIGEIRNV